MKTCIVGMFEVFCLCLCLTATAAAETTAPTDSFVGQRLEEMFQVAVASNPHALQDSQRIYDALSSEPMASPRIDYAYGLVLLKLMKPRQAQQQFLVAARRPGTVYRPAWQALIWLHFNSREYAEGYDRLLEYIKVVLDSEKLSAELRDDEIYWMGQLMSALDFVVTTVPLRESWTQADRQLQDLLGSDLVRHYKDGKQELQISHELIEEKIRSDREKLEQQRATKREKDLKRKAVVLETTVDTSDRLKRSARDASQSLQEQTAAYQKQMQRAEKDLTFLERRGMLLTAEILVLDQQINAMEGTSRNQNASNQNYAERLKALQNQRYLKDLEFQRISVLAQQVTSNAQQLTSQREESIDQAEREMSDRQEQNRINDKIKLRTIREVAELQKAETASKGSVAVSKSIATRTLRNYIEFDIATERDKVLASYGIKSGKK